MKIGGWKSRKESKELGSARVRVESSGSFGTNCGLALSRPGVTFTYACLEYQLSSLFTLVFVVLSAVVLVSSYFILERTFGLGSSSESTFFVCPDFVFLFFFRHRARLVGCLDCFPPFLHTVLALGTGTYLGIFSSPLCVFLWDWPGFFFSASFRLLHGICYSLLSVLLTEFF